MVGKKKKKESEVVTLLVVIGHPTEWQCSFVPPFGVQRADFGPGLPMTEWKNKS